MAAFDPKQFEPGKSPNFTSLRELELTLSQNSSQRNTFSPLGRGKRPSRSLFSTVRPFDLP